MSSYSLVSDRCVMWGCVDAVQYVCSLWVIEVSGFAEVWSCSSLCSNFLFLFVSPLSSYSGPLLFFLCSILPLSFCCLLTTGLFHFCQ